MTSNMGTLANTNEQTDGPPISVLKLLAAMLKQWLDMLPPELQWPEDDPTSMPQIIIVRPYGQIVDTVRNAERQAPDHL